MTGSKQKSLHDKIVRDILPKFAQRLKTAGLISDYGTEKQFEIEITRDMKKIVIKPDLTIVVPNRGKIVVEVVNPDDAKNFIGEIVYPHILGNLGRVEAAIFLILPTPESRKSERAMAQEIALHRFFKKQIPYIPIFFDSDNPEEIYHILKCSIIDYQRMGKFY